MHRIFGSMYPYFLQCFHHFFSFSDVWCWFERCTSWRILITNDMSARRVVRSTPTCAVSRSMLLHMSGQRPALRHHTSAASAKGSTGICAACSPTVACSIDAPFQPRRLTRVISVVSVAKNWQFRWVTARKSFCPPTATAPVRWTSMEQLTTLLARTILTT